MASSFDFNTSTSSARRCFEGTFALDNPVACGPNLARCDPFVRSAGSKEDGQQSGHDPNREVHDASPSWRVGESPRS
jgi:hypothetical protein